ncbi:hypothetical protein ACFOY5_10660 [Massilia aurea]|uniref:hypothetical protein n=1 Tax=Massilia aurea TaxID=373040 RepID=UPI0021612EAE|nr:hypothetical protein [Massilia aurea]MCS0709480.1 hypothetical protein [Massilia aurea]
MSTALNDRDAILQAASVRIVNPKNAHVRLDAFPLAFHMNSAGDLDVPAMTITASLTGLEGDVTFAAEGATLTQVTGKSATVRYADMQGSIAMVTASIAAGGETFSQGFLVTTLRDGAAGGSGSRGAGFYRATGNAWSDGIADAATPGGNVVGDIVIISNGVSSWPKEWDGSKWFYPGAFFPGSLLVEKSVLATHLGAESVTAEKIAGSAVTARNLVVGSPDNVVPDPRFKDLTWWGRPDAAVIQWAENGSTTGWKGGASMLLPTSGPELTRDTIYFDLTPGATYRIEGQAYLSNDFNGRLSAYLLIAGDRWYPFFDNDTGQRWADNLAVQLNNLSPKGFSTFSTTYTVPLGAATGRGMIRVRSSHTVGTAEVGSFSVTRVADGSLVGDGVLEARHIKTKSLTADLINVDRVSAVSAILGDVLLGPDGALHQGSNAYNTGSGIFIGAPGGAPKFFVGTAGGANMRYSPEEGLRIDQASLESYTAWLTGSAGGSYPNGSAGYGFLKANVSGGKAPYTYRWTLTLETKTGSAGNMVISETTSQSASFSGSGTNATLTYTVTCAVTDGNQRTIVLGTSINANHGTPP